MDTSAAIRSDEQIGAPKPPTVLFLMAEVLGGGSVTSDVLCISDRLADTFLSD